MSGFTWRRGEAFLKEGPGEGALRLRLPLEEYRLPLLPDEKGGRPAYLRFAGLVRAPVESLVAFATRYGLLGLHEASMRRVSAGARTYAGALEGLGFPDEAQQVMRRLAALEGAHRRATGSQGATLPEPVAEWRHQARQMHRALTALEMAMRARGEKADLLREAVSAYVNGHLEGPARLVRDGETWRLMSEPATLLEALWAQLALSALYAERPHRCLACGEWFIPARRDQQTCSERCRWRRQKQAQRGRNKAGAVTD